MLLFKSLIQLILVISIVLFGYSYFQKDKLPDKEEILEELHREPIQTKTNEVPFQVEKGGITYTVTPVFNYELYGLVVSQHLSKSWLDYYHDKWKDYINIKDVCVIWGDNVRNEAYKEIGFSSGSWTCYYKSKSSTNLQIWQQFKGNLLSNNHLLSDNKKISEEIVLVEKGDQIYLKGYLAQYSHSDGFQRGTSITRDDTGNGACETIYITDFKILKKGDSLMRSIYVFSKCSTIICFVILLMLLLRYLIRPFKSKGGYIIK